MSERTMEKARTVVHRLSEWYFAEGGDNDPDSPIDREDLDALHELVRRTPRGEGDGRADRMPATLAVSQSLSRVVAAMQAAWIEWMHGRGADAAMQWIENTLIGPGLIPGDDESDAQAFFDRAIAEIEEHRRGVEAEIAALAAWIAMEARMAESLGRSKVVIEWRCGVCGHWSPRWSRARCQRCGAVRGYGYRDREAVEERTVITYPTDRSESDE